MKNTHEVEGFSGLTIANKEWCEMRWKDERKMDVKIQGMCNFWEFLNFFKAFFNAILNKSNIFYFFFKNSK